MKKLLIALLTFTVGVLGFNLLTIKQPSTSIDFISEQKTINKSELKIETPPVVKTEKFKSQEKTTVSKPFFDLFDKDKFDKDDYQSYGGWFIADEFKGMKEVWTIFLDRSEENSKDEKLVWSAMVLTQHADGSPNDEADFHSVQITTKSNRLSFKTNKFRGVEYKFDGEFFKNGKEFSDDEKVLRGTMEKFVKGKRVAKFTADFAYYEPRCFH